MKEQSKQVVDIGLVYLKLFVISIIFRVKKVVCDSLGTQLFKANLGTLLCQKTAVSIVANNSSLNDYASCLIFFDFIHWSVNIAISITISQIDSRFTCPSCISKWYKIHLFNLLKIFLFWNKCQTEPAAVCGFPVEKVARFWLLFLQIYNQKHFIIYSINIFKYWQDAFSFNLASSYAIIVIPEGNCYLIELFFKKKNQV